MARGGVEDLPDDINDIGRDEDNEVGEEDASLISTTRQREEAQRLQNRMKDIAKKEKKAADKVRKDELRNRRFNSDPIEENIPLVEQQPQSIEEIEENRERALKIIEEKYPNMLKKAPPFGYKVNEFGEVEVKMLGRKDGKWHYLSSIDNDNFPKSIRNHLGESREAYDKRINEAKLRENDRKKESIDKARKETKEGMKNGTITESEGKEKLDQLGKERDKIDDEINELEKTMSISDRVKRIFKKYGFTATAIIASVGVVIGVIVSNLKSGLGKVAKGMGNGLKTIGKKLGQILPGIAGAIASFIFKAAGEVVGFLGKHAWLLIVGFVLLAIDQIKNRFKNRRTSKK